MDNNEKLSLKNILNNMLTSYVERDKQIGFEEWFADKLQNEIPNISYEDSKGLVKNIVKSVSGYEKALNDFNVAIENGEREEWIAQQLEDVYTDMPLDIVGERLSTVEKSFVTTNLQLMDGSLIEDIETTDDIEWNEFCIKNKWNNIVEQSSMFGMAATKNALEEIVQDEEGEISANLGKAFQENLKSEIKVVVAGATKVAVEKGLDDTFKDTPTEVICDMTGVAVEGAKALFDVASGDSTMTDAIDKVGRAGVVAGCRVAKFMLKDTVMKVPVVGPILVELLGGLFEHMESREFYQNVYTTVRGVAVATWDGIKSKVKNTFGMVKNTARKLFV